MFIMPYNHPNRPAALTQLLELAAQGGGTSEEQRERTKAVRLYFNDLEQENRLLREGVLSNWSLWHDNRYRLFNLNNGLIGSVVWQSKGICQVGYLNRWIDEQLTYETYYGEPKDAKIYVESKLGILRNETIKKEQDP